MKICKVFPLYNLSNVISCGCEVTFEVILHPSRVRTLVCLVMLDGCEVKFEKSSHVHLGEGDTWSR